MERCIRLALNGLGRTYPNPLVGCVIVHNGKIIGEGWHQKAGEPHAEVNAINSVKDESLLPESTLYVNLEPCSHRGRTPPCSDLIVRKKIKNVVIGSVDYNSQVYGKGIDHLKKHGCNVIVGIKEKECYELNKRFFTFHKKKRPYIILKWAETRDGFIFPDKKDEEGVAKPVWITNKYSLQKVHQLRANEQSILVGFNTAKIDNPRLNLRDYFGKDPLRLLIDKNLKTSADSYLLDRKTKTVVFNAIKDKNIDKNLIYIKLDFSEDVPRQIVKYLYEQEIQSLIVEGGAVTLQSFIEEGLWDEAWIFTGDVSFQKGLKAPVLEGNLKERIPIVNDELRIYTND
ncbi:MAG: bifunctional diaminohydroxyphosphoribosylaminopyrimidine deaminase/5-amino-6-(5-phosphoribosylamino)uracil reductase RibD [Flavobacteriia bacterium]|nr:MAG: bifunctional diaminohydroxyphosphoribosylaminopyrimidine deaminase/5-amino-6-(5-phosphoribosylamino)uracil reductase RibD [Flavobacteriia bacterium]